MGRLTVTWACKESWCRKASFVTNTCIMMTIMHYVRMRISYKIHQTGLTVFRRLNLVSPLSSLSMRIRQREVDLHWLIRLFFVVAWPVFGSGGRTLFDFAMQTFASACFSSQRAWGREGRSMKSGRQNFSHFFCNDDARFSQIQVVALHLQSCIRGSWTSFDLRRKM